MLRLAASLKYGHVTASLIVAKLSRVDRQNSLAAALKEYGALRRTVYAARDLALGLCLVRRVVRERRDGALPPRRPFGTGDQPGPHVLTHRAVLQLDHRVCQEVVIPDGVLRRTALGRHGRIPAFVFDPHHRVLAQDAALGAAAGDDDHRHAAQRGPLGAAGALVELDLVADPLRGAGLVVPSTWHAPRIYIPPAGRGRWCRTAVARMRPRRPPGLELVPRSERSPVSPLGHLRVGTGWIGFGHPPRIILGWRCVEHGHGHVGESPSPPSCQ